MPGREEFKREYLESIAETCSKPFAECSRMERYTALAAMIRECCSGVRAETLRRRAAAGEKIVYYFSMEFLVGRLLENYLIQLGIRDMTADILAELGEDLDALLECERDPGLGNGGLGRLAACYLDSLAAEDVPCVGMGLRYRYGLFRQRIRSGCQTEEPDDWLSDGYPWETAVPSEAVEVRFGGTVDRREENGRMVYELRDYRSVLATPYDVPILGYGAHAVNNLRLWRAGPVHKQLDLDAFNAGDYSRAQKANNDAEAITCLLYPDDNTPAGQQLRLQQEYFFVCAGLQSMLRTFRATHLSWDKLPERVGDGWVEKPEKLEGLLAYADDTESLRELAKVKLAAKKNLCDYIARDFGIACNPDGVIDVQVKRIHAYKRQLLNAFKILALYDRLKDDPYAKVPASTFVFAGKAAHSYAFAKESIRFVCAVADLVNADPVVSRRMKVVFMENFGVTMGQRIYPAADISEQISTAGKEASGTGCMKFMMNGAVTLGTLDGANVEILERVGAENISIFGLTSEETERFTTQGGYNARECAESDPVLARVLAHLTDGSLGSKFWDLEDALLKYNDEFFVLRDFAPYLAAWDALAGETGNLSFQRKALVNIAKSGWFSSDRAVAEYVSDIWKIR